MKKKLILIVLAMTLLTGCTGKAPKLANGEDAIVTFKNGDKISIDEVWNEMKDNYALQILLNKIDSSILEKEYEDKKDDIQEYVDSYEASLRANYKTEEELLEYLANYGYSSLDYILEQQRTSYMKNLAVDDYALSTIKEKEIKNYYEKEAIGDISAVHILVKPASSSSSDDKTAKEKAEKIIKAIKKDIKSGTSAANAFKKYDSYSSDSAVTYQDLGYFNRGDMAEPFEKAVIKMKKGSYSSEPVKTSYGYHIILKIDQKKKDSYDKLKDSIKKTLADKLVKEDSTINVKAFRALREKYGVEITDDNLRSTYNRYINYQLNQK